MAVAVYQFGDFRLDCGRFELLRNGHTIPLERKPMELLILLLVRKEQLVTRAEIAAHLWSSEVFVNTEHGINTAIRKIRTVLRDDPEKPVFVQTITGKGYRFIAPIAAVNGAAAGSELVELAAESAGASHRAEAETSSRSPRWKLWFALGAGLCVAALILAAALGPHAWIDGLLRRTTRPAITSLAVLPLDNLSGDPNQEYFADGMTDELITVLARDSTLRIISRTSVMQYKGARKPLPEIARALHVDGILEGSVSRTNGQVHMTLQLIRADADTHLWADSYDRDPSQVAALPGEAAHEIANYLHSSVASTTTARYVNPEAHDAYLRGRYLWFRGQNEDAGNNFRKAVRTCSPTTPPVG